MSNYIRFDWAMKRLLRNKANFAVLEGFLTTLLRDRIKIQKLLESESNQEEEFDKYNRVDLLAEDSKGTLLLIEIQNNNEYAYFQRMLFGTSKLVTEYINRGEGYDKVRKVYSINIVYFSLGHGKDIVYHGKTEFRGIHQNDILELSPFQRQTFKVDTVSQLYPEYYILKVNDLYCDPERQYQYGTCGRQSRRQSRRQSGRKSRRKSRRKSGRPGSRKAGRAPAKCNPDESKEIPYSGHCRHHRTVSGRN